MKAFFIALILAAALGISAAAQENRDMPIKGPMTKEGMPMKGEGMQHGAMDMKQMHDRMMQMQKDRSGMMKGQGMMKHDEMAWGA